MVFQCINIRQVPWEMLKTVAFGLDFQHLPRDLANVNAWKTMFDPYIIYDKRNGNHIAYEYHNHDSRSTETQHSQSFRKTRALENSDETNYAHLQ